MPRILSSSLSDLGRKRANNEDFVTSFEPTDLAEQEASGSLYIVADGVGGAALGERASQYAAEKVLYEYYLHPEIEVGERLRLIIEQINEEIFSFADQSNSISRMGTTLVAAAIQRDQLTVANVGDSRAYLIRAGEATQITRDHNLVGELVNNGSMTEVEALKSKVKNRLTRALGSEEEIRVDIFSEIQLQPGDQLLLCTDGLTRYALREDIASLTHAGMPDEIVHDLVDFANEQGGADNISVTLVAFEPAAGVWQVARVQKIPGPVSWDRIQTEPRVPVIRPAPPLWDLMSQLHLPAAPMFWILLGLGAVVLIGALTFSGSRNADLALATKPTLSPAMATSPVIASQSPKSTASFAPIIPQSEAPTLIQPLSSESPTLTPTNNPESLIQKKPTAGNPACQYTVQATDNSISQIYFNLTKTLGPPYPGISCANIPGNTCTYTSNNPNYIQPDWILLIENVDPAICQQNKGISIPASTTAAPTTPAP